ncbi:hypothetical protein DERP_003116 [Dermatophagoides pteronyssinus]|uniref:Uncharacterized protein n=1 Tax=Dermatophagoides pteronyssinus TaxID=6956 RepID=A0ABQ8JJ73_DERPT|nr:hypothetical protein DERP_003116 [Dermatophagoides pteronyssinus]
MKFNSRTTTEKKSIIIIFDVVELNNNKSIQSNNRLKLTSLSDVPQIPQDLHSIHCQRYFFTDNIIVGVNCKQDGCADRPQSEHDTRSSASYYIY